MGLHICIMNDEWEDHPDWDDLRQWDDKRFPNLPYEKVSCQSDSLLFRPKSISEFREVIANSDFDRKERYLLMAEILERNPEYYIYFCT